MLSCCFRTPSSIIFDDIQDIETHLESLINISNICINKETDLDMLEYIFEILPKRKNIILTIYGNRNLFFKFINIRKWDNDGLRWGLRRINTAPNCFEGVRLLAENDIPITSFVSSKYKSQTDSVQKYKFKHIFCVDKVPSSILKFASKVDSISVCSSALYYFGDIEKYYDLGIKKIVITVNSDQIFLREILTIPTLDKIVLRGNYGRFHLFLRKEFRAEIVMPKGRMTEEISEAISNARNNMRFKRSKAIMP